jgi:predicted permease
MGKLIRRISALIHRGKLRRELEEEMAAHREMMPVERQKRFGGTLRLHEESGDQWGWTWLDQLHQDLVYGLRSLRRSPGFTLTAISVLALGIGVNLAEIQFMRAILHRLNVRDVDSLYQFRSVDKRGTGPTFSFPVVDFYRRYNTTLSSLITETDAENVYHADDPENVRCSFVSTNFFGEIGVLPAYGRMLDEEDDKPGAEPVAVPAWSYWQARFAGDPGLVTKTIRLNGKPVRIAGIAPPQFIGVMRQPNQIWIPTSQYTDVTGDSRLPADYGARATFMLARLRPGVSPESAQAQFGALLAEMRKRQPDSARLAEAIQIQPAGSLGIPTGPALLLFVTFVLLVLLVLFSACANLGNMLLARGLARGREIEIRLAVGAGRWRLIRQLMTENLLLAGMASLAAWFVGTMAVRRLMAILDMPQLHVQNDWRLLLACAALGLLSTLAFGLAPALHALRRGHKGLRARRVLVSVQVCVSCVLLILSSFLTRAVQKTYQADVSFDLDRMTLVDPAYYLHGYTAVQAQHSAVDMATCLRHMPGIDGASATTVPPLKRGRIEVVSGQQLYLNGVDDFWFPMMGLPVLRGRLFEPGDRDVAVVSESAARRLWPNESPIGKTCLISNRNRTVIGVAKDSGANLMRHPESVEMYTPIDATDAVYATIVVHAIRDPKQMSSAIRSAATQPGIIPQVATFQSLIDNQADVMRKTVEIIGSLGAVASWLAMIGIFGLLAFTVAQRTREIGVRIALGAGAFDVLRAVLAEYAMPFGIGSALGAVVAIAAAQMFRSVAFGFLPFDPLSIGAGLLLFAAISVAAAIIPARRALGVDPATALRYE